MFDHSKIVLYRSKTTNKGAIFFEKDTLDQTEAKKEARSKVDHFLNYLLVTLNVENMMPLRFPEPPELLNSEEFKGMPRTVSVGIDVHLAAPVPFEKSQAEAVNTLMKKTTQLDSENQTAINKCLFWMRRGAETRKEERFIYRWISFEALFKILQEEYSSTQKMLSVLLNTYLKNETAKSIYAKNKKMVNELAEADLVGFFGAKQSEKLKRMLQEQADFKAIMIRAMLCVFEVRNRLFHRGEEMSLIPACNSLLRYVINETLIAFLETPCARELRF